MPFDLFKDRNRVATFAAVFLAGGVMFTLTVLIGLYVQDIMGYSPLRAGIGFIPFVIALGIGLGLSSQLVQMFPPRLLVIAGGVLVLGAMIYGSTLDANIPYFPNLVLPITIGGMGIGMIVVPLMLSAIAGGWASTRSARCRRSRSCCRTSAVPSCSRSSSRDHLAHAVSGRYHRTGQRHERPAAARPRPGLHLWPAVGRRRRGDRRLRVAVHRLHRIAGGARAGSQGRDRLRRVVISV